MLARSLSTYNARFPRTFYSQLWSWYPLCLEMFRVSFAADPHPVMVNSTALALACLLVIMSSARRPLGLIELQCTNRDVIWDNFWRSVILSRLLVK